MLAYPVMVHGVQCTSEPFITPAPMLTDIALPPLSMLDIEPSCDPERGLLVTVDEPRGEDEADLGSRARVRGIARLRCGSAW